MRWWVGLVAMVTGCYATELTPCLVRCSQSGACPAGLSCVEGLCALPGSGGCSGLDGGGDPLDGSAGDAARPDAPLLDAALGVSCGGAVCADYCCAVGETALCDTCGAAGGYIYGCDG